VTMCKSHKNTKAAKEKQGNLNVQGYGLLR
jgi:hypothetical protein